MDEEPVKLSELIEILEGFDGDSSLHVHDFNSSIEESGISSNGDRNVMAIGGSTVLMSKVCGNMRRPRLKRIRKVGSVPYSTDLQRRRRAELVSLRSEAQNLEDKLTKLRQQCPGEEVGKWRKIAEIALKERQCSERTNQELKELVSSRLNAFSSIRKLVAKNGVLEGKEFVFQEEAKSTREANFLEVLEKIADCMQELYFQADSIFPALPGNPSVMLESRKRRYETRDNMSYNCINTTSVTPVSCTISEAWMNLWEQLTRRKDTEPEKLYRFIRAKRNTSLEMSFTLPVRDEKRKIVCIDAVSTYRKYEEENRFVLVGKTVWVLRAGGLQFETLHWTIISPSPTDQAQASVVQSCNELRVINADGMSAEAATILLTTIGGKLRRFMSIVQMGLLRS